MSITLDVNTFLQSELSGLLVGATTASNNNNATASVQQNTTSKMETVLHNEELARSMAEPRDEASNIFDEIENFLKLSKFMDNSGNLDVTEQPSKSRNVTKSKVSSHPSRPQNKQQPITISSPDLEFPEFTLPHSSIPSHFPLPDEAHNLQELDPQLFSVEDGQLLPISSPFMVPGIYKKLSNGLRDGSTGDTAAKPNVFISAHEKHGCVVAAARFQELYVCADANGEPPENYVKANQRPVLLLEALEALDSDDEDEEGIVKTDLGFNCGKRVPKQWDALSKLAYNILKLSNRDPIVIDRKRNEIVRTNNATSLRTIYRFLSPEKFGLKPYQNHAIPVPHPSKTSPKTVPVRTHKRLGRPPKRAAEEKELGEVKAAVKKPKQRKTETLQMASQKETLSPAQQTVQSPASDSQLQRTRFGRIVRNRQAVTKTETTDPPNEPPRCIEYPAGFLQNFLTDLKDNDYRCSRPITPLAIAKADTLTQPSATSNATPSETHDLNSASSPAARRRKIPPESVCPTCNKIFLGRRMQRHYVQHPDHIQLPAISQAATLTAPPPPPPPFYNGTAQAQPNDEMSLFRFLVSKLQRTHLSEDQRADLFLNEINDLVTQLQLRSSRLIRNTSGLHFVSARCSRVLGIPEGHYALDMMAIENEAPPPPPIEPVESSSNQPCLLNFEHLSSSALPAPPATARNLDYTALSMSLDDTLTDEAAQKLNLSAGGKLLPPSEESLLRTVGDLVHDGMQKLQQQSAAAAAAAENLTANMGAVPMAKSTLLSTLVPPGIHYEHASDNAVEAVNMKETIAVPQAAPILGLSVDFFQFNNGN